MSKQYIGARYVIKVYENTNDPSSAEWQENVNYEPLVLVTFHYGSYLSKKTVPASVGNPASNPDYWVQTGFYNGQIAELQSEVTRLETQLFGETRDRTNADTALSNRIQTNSNNIAAEVTNRTNADTALSDRITANAGAITGESATRSAADANLQTQIDQIIAPSGEAPSAAEVLNARIGQNGITYDTLGEAIRTQIEMLSDLLFGSLTADTYVDYRDGTEVSSVSYSCTDYIPCALFDIAAKTVAANDNSGIVFYNANRQYISGYKAVTNTGNLVTLTKPANTAFVRITCLKANTNELVIKYVGMQNTLNTKINDKLDTSKAIAVSGGVGTTYDFDNAPLNTILNISSGAMTVADNHVPYDGFVGSIMTICGSPSALDVYMQIGFSATRAPALWIRAIYGGTWADWQRCSLTSELNANIALVRNESKVYNILKVFSNLTCCGDSFTYGQVYTGANSSRQAKKPYPQLLGEYADATVENLSTSGYSASDWWYEYGDDIVSKTDQLAVIYLGTNGGFTDTLATDAPVNTPYASWDNTNTGCLAKIIAKFKEAGAKILLIKLWTTSGNLDTSNDVLEQCATRFGCGIIGNSNINKFSLHAYPDLSGQNETHYNDLGYAVLANQIIQNVGNMDSDYQKYLIPS